MGPLRTSQIGPHPYCQILVKEIPSDFAPVLLSLSGNENELRSFSVLRVCSLEK